jgi:hypothetical protein
MSKPVQVYILMGQSNMLGFGKVASLQNAVNNNGLYPYLIDADGAWTVRKDVRNVRVMCSGSGPWKTYKNEWMTISGNVGPEIGIGHHIGNVLDAPVLILKSCIGNRSLGYDLLPPSAPGYEGDKDDPSRTPVQGGWYAGVQYDGDTKAAKDVLKDLDTYYPGAKKFEVAGFCFWQGAKDLGGSGSADKYEENLVHFIKDLRKDFDAPNALFVCATMGQAPKGGGGAGGKITDAQLAVDGKTGKYPEFKGNVATFYSNPVSKGGSANGHYGGHAETYMNVGEGMGKAMAELLANKVPGGAVRRIVDEKKLDRTLQKVFKALVNDKLALADSALGSYLADKSGKGEEQLSYADKLDEYLTSLTADTIDQMQVTKDSGDLYSLKAALAKNDKMFLGIPAYDDQRKEWAADLNSETASAELAVGAQFHALVARKDKLKPASYFVAMHRFQEENPDSFYVDRADEEAMSIETLAKKSVKELNALGEKGDIYAKFTQIAEAKATLSRIPSFDEANAKWIQEYKQANTRKEYSVGKAYAKIFADIDALKKKFKKLEAKNNKMKSVRSRAKAVAKTKRQFVGKLKPMVNKLEKLADANGDSYYGQNAKIALDGYLTSDRTTIKNPLGKKRK